MNKNKLLSTGLLALTVGLMGFGAGLATQSVDASDIDDIAEKKAMLEQIEREVLNIDNGVEITITSEDSEVVEKIQENHSDTSTRMGPHQEEVSVEVEMIDDGVIVTLTSENPEAVEIIQERAAEGPFRKAHLKHDCDKDTEE